jgi:transposase
VDQLANLQQIGGIERHIHAEHRSNDASQRLETIPGIGVIGATALEFCLGTRPIQAAPSGENATDKISRVCP